MVVSGEVDWNVSRCSSSRCAIDGGKAEKEKLFRYAFELNNGKKRWPITGQRTFISFLSFPQFKLIWGGRESDAIKLSPRNEKSSVVFLCVTCWHGSL